MSAAAEFVRGFAAAWSPPVSAAGLAALIHPEGVLVTPLMSRAVGRAAAERQFGRLLRRIPDLHADVGRWAGDEDALFVEIELVGSVARRELAWPAIDRFLLRDGLIAERVSYFDPLPLVLESLKRPAGLPAMLALRRRP